MYGALHGWWECMYAGAPGRIVENGSYSVCRELHCSAGSNIVVLFVLVFIMGCLRSPLPIHITCLPTLCVVVIVVVGLLC